MAIVLTAFFILFPIVLIYLCQRIPALDKLGAVVLAFGIGILFSAFIDFGSLFPNVDVIASQTQLSEIAIALALPMLVFSVDLRSAFSLAGETMKSMAIALLTVMFMSAILAWFFQDRIDQMWQVAGMSVGAYTGGGPNMAAIKTAIDGDQNVFVMMTTYDLLLSAFYLIFVLTLAKPIFGRFLIAFDFKAVKHEDGTTGFDHMSDESAHAFKKLAEKSRILETIQVLIFSGIAVGIGVAVAGLFPESMASAATIIAITSMGLVFSFIPYIRDLTNSFQMGMYLILVFCFTMGTMTDTNVLFDLNMDLFAYIGLILIGSLCVHAVFCKLFRIDADTFIITSSAAIMSVPFIPIVAGALKNKEIILPGFAAAILGYALGNYLGVTMAYFTQWMIGS